MSLLDTLAIDSSARYISGKGDPRTAGFQLTRQWPNIHADYADTVIAAKDNARKITNPKADKQTYSGQFIVSSVDPQERADRSVDVNQTLTKFVSVTDTGMKKTNSERDRTKSTMNLFGIEEGTENVAVVKYPWLDNTDTASDSSISVDVDTVSGYRIAQRRFVVNDRDRTGTLFVAHSKDDWTNTTPTFTTKRIVNEGGYGENWAEFAPGVPIDSAVNWVADTGRTGDTLLTFGLQERAKGEGHLDRLRRIGNQQGAVTRRTYNTLGSLTGSVKTWYGVQQSNTDTTFKLALTYSDTGLTKTGASKDVRPDGYATITGAARAITGSTWNGWPESSDTNTWEFLRRSYRRNQAREGSNKNEIRHWTVKHMDRQFTGVNAAHTFVIEGNATNLPSSGVSRAGSYKWIGIKERYKTVGAWRVDTTAE